MMSERFCAPRSTASRNRRPNAGSRRYSGAWRLDENRILVSSAYGSAAAFVRRRRPELVAEELLRALAK